MNSLQECNSAVPEVTSIVGETEKTRENYGLNKNELGLGKLLTSETNAERGVRHVQLFSGGSLVRPESIGMDMKI